MNIEVKKRRLDAGWTMPPSASSAIKKTHESLQMETNELRMAPDTRWGDHGLSMAWFEQKSEWLRRENGAPGCVSNFFDSAGRLFRLCGYDYNLLGPMFFHAVIGLEAILRIYYKEGSDTGFKELLGRAIEERVINDDTFTTLRPLPDYFLVKLIFD